MSYKVFFLIIKSSNLKKGAQQRERKNPSKPFISSFYLNTRKQFGANYFFNLCKSDTKIFVNI